MTNYDILKEYEANKTPVPSYEEWKKAHECVVSENEGITTLKELLKECKQWFDWYHIDTGTGKEYIESWHKKGHEIHQKINQALGEDK